MAFIVGINVSGTFTGRKGRKLLAPIPISVTFGGPPPTVVGPCVLRFSLPGGSGQFFVQPVPTLWTPAVDDNTVQTPQFSPFTSQNFTAFAAFFYADDLG